MECTTCLDPITDTQGFWKCRCKNTQHLSCAHTWLKDHKTCTICKDDKSQRINGREEQQPTDFTRKLCTSCLAVIEEEDGECRCDCGYSFHEECYISQISRNDKCPICNIQRPPLWPPTAVEIPHDHDVDDDENVRLIMLLAQAISAQSGIVYRVVNRL